MHSAIRSPLTVSTDSGRTVIGFPAEIDARNAALIRDSLMRLLQNETHPVVLDLTETRFCDCAGLKVMLQAHRRARGLSVVVPDSGPVRRIFTLAGLAERIPAGLMAPPLAPSAAWPES